MAITINVYPYDSPRIIEIPDTITDITVQEVVDAVRAWEDSEVGMRFDYLIDAAGKENLGGNVKVGITATLQNAQIAFEDRAGPTFVQCSISGGNLVAIDDVGDDLNPVAVTDYTQVVRTSSSSATLQELGSIQYSSFGGGVTLDTTSPYSGTTFPVGTPQEPVNNLTDAVSIATERGFATIFVIGDATIDSSGDYDGMIFVGESITKTELTISSGASVVGCEFFEATVTGTLDGNAKLKNCKIGTLNYIYGVIEQCLLVSGTITLGGSNPAHFLDCWSGVAGTSTPIIDLGGSGQELSIRNYNGGIELQNKSGSESVSIDLNVGRVVLDSTVTAGTIVIRGVGTLENYGTATVNFSSLISGEKFKDLQYNVESLRPHHTGYGNVYYWDPINGNDTNSGSSIEFAVKTFSRAHDLAADYGHDIIVAYSGNTTGVTVVDENISVTKNFLFVRGPGKDFQLYPTTVNASGFMVDILGEGIELSGIEIDGVNAPANNKGIKIDGDFALIKNIWLEECDGNAIEIANSNETIIDGNFIGYNAGDGIKVNNTVEDLVIKDNHVDANTGHGINLAGTAIHEVILQGRNILHESGGYGLNIGTGAEETHIGSDTQFIQNTSGDINDLGTDTHLETGSTQIYNVVKKGLTIGQFLALK